jgi:hypothetical protein
MRRRSEPLRDAARRYRHPGHPPSAERVADLDRDFDVSLHGHGLADQMGFQLLDEVDGYLVRHPQAVVASSPPQDCRAMTLAE